MPNFRKKPVVIEARQWIDTDEKREEFATWFDEHLLLFATRGPQVAVDTLEGTMYANPGDWIIKGVKGEFYPCKPDIFAATYDQEPDLDPELCGEVVYKHGQQTRLLCSKLAGHKSAHVFIEK